MGFPFEQVSWPAGADNMGGLSTVAYFAPASAIMQMPEFDPKDGITRKGEFKMAQGTCFVSIYVTYGTASLSSEPVGEADCRCSKLTGEFFHPGSTPEAATFARAVQNTQGVFAFKDTSGRIRLVGDVVNPATVKAKHETGKKPDERKGWTIAFEAYSERPITFFEGEIPTTPAP